MKFLIMPASGIRSLPSFGNFFHSYCLIKKYCSCGMLYLQYISSPNCKKCEKCHSDDMIHKKNIMYSQGPRVLSIYEYYILSVMIERQTI